MTTGKFFSFPTLLNILVDPLSVFAHNRQTISIFFHLSMFFFFSCIRRLVCCHFFFWGRNIVLTRTSHLKCQSIENSCEKKLWRIRNVNRILPILQWQCSIDQPVPGLQGLFVVATPRTALGTRLWNNEERERGDVFLLFPAFPAPLFSFPFCFSFLTSCSSFQSKSTLSRRREILVSVFFLLSLKCF